MKKRIKEGIAIFEQWMNHVLRRNHVLLNQGFVLGHVKLERTIRQPSGGVR